MIKSNFQIETKKLCKIESELLKLISDSGNESLQNKFLEWQEQGDICNEVLITELERHLAPNVPMHRIDCNENESSSSNTLHSFTEGGYVGND